MKNINENSNYRQRKSNRTLLLPLAILVILMFGFGYAMVPLYNVLCNVLGLNGKTGGKTTIAATVDNNRWVKVQFIATLNANLPFKFYPLETAVEVHPGQNRQVMFYAKNESGKPITVQAIPSLSPGLAAKYMKKTECFCFTRQVFAKGQAMDMPMIFHIDPALPKNIKTVTLSYTMFDTAGINSKSNKVPGKIN